MQHREDSYAESMAQANKEAKAALLGLLITVAVWLVSGFGLAGCGIRIAHTPLWIFTGCLATWVCAIIISVVLARKVITDVDLDAVAAEDAACEEQEAAHV